jgi:hypothetical protein
MENGITRLQRGDNIVPPNPNMRAPLQYQKIYRERVEEHRPREPRV